MHSVSQKRIQKLNSHEIQDGVNGPVLYWMNRDMRLEDNWALLHAQNLAQQHDRPLQIVYNFVENFLKGGERQQLFKIMILKELQEKARDYKIGLDVIIGQEKELETYIKDLNPSVVVTDFSPLKIQRQWGIHIRSVLENSKTPFYRVDAHNIVPVWEASEKQEYAAHTFRRKIHRLLPEWLLGFSVLKEQDTKSVSYKGQEELSRLEEKYVLQDVSIPSWCPPAFDAAHKKLEKFLSQRFNKYVDERNDPLKEVQSDLSVYLHYGVVSAQRVVWEVLDIAGEDIEEVVLADRNGSATTNNASAFLEELIVRRELADNYCFYNENYDNFAGFHDWAQTTLNDHRKDEREYLYTLEQFENAQTHDDLWNAAQLEMVKRGKMSGYMRMYWAKKILQWTESPEQAIEYAIYLNDKYSMDGRDPNGYVGILWSIGGLHDRPWFERPVFGKVRYMAESGCKKKFDVKAYIEKWAD